MATVARPMTVFCDSLDERWPSMDLVAEMLIAQWRGPFAARVDVRAVQLSIPRLARRLPRLRHANLAFKLDRLATRFVGYPGHALACGASARFPGSLFHVADHTYAQIVHSLPGARTGVYCHDVDAFRCLFKPERDPRPTWFRALAQVILRGMQKAAVVFHSTQTVRDEIERHGLVPPSRLVHAPYGVSPEFEANELTPRTGEVDLALAPLGGRPFLLHVGNALPRKRLDVLFDAFARVLPTVPDLRLVQQGAELSAAQREQVRFAGLEGHVLQPPKLSRTALADLYRRATLVLVTSEAEGFGFPVIEALACGAVVVASDIPVLREVGGAAAVYCRVGDPVAWAATLRGLLRSSIGVPPRIARLAQAARYTWNAHANTVLEAYEALPARGP